MYEPNVTATAKLMDRLREIEDIRQLLRTIPVLPIVEEHIQRKALVETVHYTTRIEGNPLDIRTVEKLGVYPFLKPNIQRPHEQEVLNLYKVMEFIRYVADQADIPIDEEVIKQIHAFVVRDIPSQGPPSVYKKKPNEIVHQATRERIFMPPSPGDTVRLMSDLSTWLSRTPLALHPVIAAGLAHLELVAIHPFDDGNGRTARALADLVLYRYGYTFRYLFSWVAQVGINMGTYHQSLSQALGPEYGANVDPTLWLEYFAESVAKSLLEKKSELFRIRETFISAYNLGGERGLSRDQVEAIMFAAVYGFVTTGIYMRARKLSRSTTVKRLNELVQAGIMKQVGKGRSVRYVVVPTEELMSEEQRTRGIQLGLEMIEGSVTK